MIETASLAELAVRTVSPTPLRTRATKRRIPGSSSTMRIVFNILSAQVQHAASSDLCPLELASGGHSDRRWRSVQHRRRAATCEGCEPASRGAVWDAVQRAIGVARDVMLFCTSRPPLQGILCLRSPVRYPKIPAFWRWKLRPTGVIVIAEK